jgi:hypothetical protein
VIPARTATGELTNSSAIGEQRSLDGRTERLPRGPADAAPEQGQPHAFGVADHDLVPDLDVHRGGKHPQGISKFQERRPHYIT